MFQVWNVNVPKTRIGPNGDGGYVILDSLFGATCIIGYGVSDNVQFDNEFVNKYNVPSYIFDHTVDEPKNLDPRIFFTKEGISSKNESPLFTLITHVKRHVPDNDNFVLKMDIEGAEWDVFKTADLSRVTQLIVELHDMDKAPIEIVKLINEKFYLVHIHGNNYPKQPYVKIDRVRKMPVVLECTWVRKDLVQFATPCIEAYPTNLDFKNDPESQELILNFWKKVDRPMTFVAPDLEQRIMLEKIKNTDDQIVVDIKEAKYSRIFILKNEDYVPCDIIMGLDDIIQEGHINFPIVKNGIVSLETRFINGTGPTFSAQVPIFNIKPFFDV